MPKFRTIFTIEQEPTVSSEKEALEDLHAMSDDLGEFAMNAYGRTSATLQRWNPKEKTWQDVERVEE